MFIRFASPRIDCNSRRETGIFTLAYDLKRSGNLDKWEFNELCNLLKIFESGLAIPACFRNEEMRDSLRTQAICWFKGHSEEMVQSMWLMAWFLRERGIVLQFLRTRLPGRVLYEDKHQIAAVPCRQTRLHRKWI